MFLFKENVDYNLESCFVPCMFSKLVSPCENHEINSMQNQRGLQYTFCGETKQNLHLLYII